MNSKGMLYALAVVAMDIIAVASVINASIDPHEKEYKTAIAQAQQYESEHLCDKAIEEYYKACTLKDSQDLRVKIADLYEEGYENGEYETLADRNSVLESIIRDYPDYTESYDTLIKYYSKQEDYSSCAVYVREAKANEISTPVIEECYEKIRHLYSESGVPYDTIESFGTCMLAKRKMTGDYYVYDKDGNIVYEDEPGKVYDKDSDEEENEDRKPKTKKVEYTEFTYLYDDGTVSEPIDAVDMSPSADVYTGEDTGYTIYYCKNYGNSLVTFDLSEKVYSGLVIDGARSAYVGEDNEYEACGPFASGVIVLKNSKNGKYDMFNNEGQKVNSEPYDYLGTFSNELIYAEKGGNKFVMDSSANNLFDQGIDDVILKHGGRCSISGRMFVKYAGSSKYTLYDTEQRTNIDFECDDADLFLDSAAAFEKDGKWGFVRNDGVVVIEPKYEEAKSFSNNFAAVKKDGKWGFINKQEEMIVEPEFDDVMYFDSEGSVYAYKKDFGWELIKLFYVE